jgi:hypothetical protein
MSDFVVQNYVKEGGGYCAEKLGVSVNAVHCEAQRLGIRNPKFLKWCDEEDRFLVYHYHKDGSLYCSMFLNRTKAAIVNRAILLKLEPMRPSKTWMEWEEEVIRRYYPTEGIAGCYIRLGKTRSQKAIKSHASVMDVRRKGGK